MTMTKRRYDIDWLRVIAMLAVFLFHCSFFFAPVDWHLKNRVRVQGLGYPYMWLDQWMMPIFFLLSGFGSWHSLRSRSWWRYLVERVLRLLLPLYTVGAFLLLPPQFYIEQVSHGRYSGSLWKLIPPYRDSYGSFRFRLDEPRLTNVWFGHMWFLQFLFSVSVLALPLLLLLRTRPGKRTIARLAKWSARWGGIFLFLIPLIAVRIALRSTFHGEQYQSWADLAFYGVVFLIGALFAGDERFLESCRRHTWVCLVLGVLAWVGEGFFISELRYPYPGFETFSGHYLLFQAIMGVGSWSWMVFLLGLGARYFNVDSRVRAYASEAVLPFYLLHQTVILVVGWWIIPLEWPVLVSFPVITIASFVLIMAVYEALIRRINPVRFLFGMRIKGRRLFVRREKRAQ
jgi:peptidoglycan/LPS O-acetylase OafA/YrhL